MSARLTLAGVDDFDRLAPLVTAFHEEMALGTTPEHRARAIAPLLEGIPQGAIYLIGPRSAPVGYVALAFGWSIEYGGLDGFVEEIYVRPGVRGRGMGTEALLLLGKTLSDAGVVSLTLEAEHGSPAEALYRKLGFEGRPTFGVMSVRLAPS